MPRPTTISSSSSMTMSGRRRWTSSIIHTRTLRPGASSSAHHLGRSRRYCSMLPSLTELAPLDTLPSPGSAMSSVSNVIEFPVRHDYDADSLEHDLVLEVATADDVASGMARVVERVRRHSGA